MGQFLIIGIYNLLWLCGGQTVLLKENFDYPDGELPPLFWSEGCPGLIKNGRLFIEADTAEPRASSVWLSKELDGDLCLQYDVYLGASADDANNINLFFMYKGPSGKTLKETAVQRQDGLYKRYHALEGYIFTNITNGDQDSIRYRFRKNPGFGMVSETRLKRERKSDSIHIKLIKKGNLFQYWENGRKIIDKELSPDTATYHRGLFGWRTWHTTLEIDNLLIRRI